MLLESTMTNQIDPEVVRNLLRYEPETGRLYWRERPSAMFSSQRSHSTWNARYAGREALTADNGLGYKIGSIFNRHYLAHRIAWVIIYGKWPDVIDHINGNPGDNRLSNLRSVTVSENCCNSKRNRKNTSGQTGVTWSRAANKWAAQISLNGQAHFIGVFSDKADAIAARKSAERDLGFHPNHGRIAS